MHFQSMNTVKNSVGRVQSSKIQWLASRLEPASQPDLSGLSTVITRQLLPMSISAAGKPYGQAPATFEIKSADLPLVALIIKTSHLDQLAADLMEQYGPQGESSDFFDHDALVFEVIFIQTKQTMIRFHFCN